MYNIVIADDEILERTVLRQMLKDYLGDSCVIRLAENGREAVESALIVKADLVIMDIEMPGMNGLNAARTIVERLPNCKIMMLTAYSEFKYAQEAISFGSADYLLKPCTDEDMKKAIDRVLGEIDRRRQGEQEKERSRERIHTLSLQLEEQIVRTVMGGHVSPEYLESQMQTYGVDFQNGVFAILYDPKTNNAKSILPSLKQTIWPECIHPFLYCYDDKVYIVNISDNADVDSASVTEQQLKTLSKAAQTLWGHPLFGAIGKSFSSLQYAQLSSFQAHVALSGCSNETPICVHCDDALAENSPFADNPIINSVLLGDAAEISRVSSSFVNTLFAQHLKFDIAQSRLNLYMAKTVHSLRVQTGFSLPDIVVSLPANEEDRENMKLNVASQLCHLADQIIAHSETKDPDHLQKVRQEIETYVAQHFHEDIFLPGIARSMNYSVAYFSKLFKQCFQRNFITYLTDVRIEAAKELMRRSNLTIREIGEQVGYKDPNYFTKVFRKTVGTSPSEYRALL